MYYVVAAASPQEVNNDQQIAQFISQNVPLLSEPNRNQNPHMNSSVHMFNIDKSQFKIGSLDLLMQLNETTARIDSQLDTVCKKIEKIEQDTRGDQEGGNLTYRANYAGPGTPYSQYIRDFKWESLKYPTKRSLNELSIQIQKNMLQKDEQIRKNMEEFNNMKQRIQTMTKKDTGSLQVRDFTDDIYKGNQQAEAFVEHHESEMFANLLLVVNDEKLQTVNQKLPTMMSEYYEQMDVMEKKRFRESAKQKFSEIMMNHKKYELAVQKLQEEDQASRGAAEERKGAGIEEENQNKKLKEKLESWEEKYQDLMKNKRNPGQIDARDQEQMTRDEDHELFLHIEHYLMKDNLEALAAAQKKRMPLAIVPRLRMTGIEDRENNKVYHTIVHKPQLDDVIKACRKFGFLAKPFVYDRNAWETERRELVTLKEQYDNKRKHINQVSTDLFQDCLVALMHLKVIRAYIEGVLRFGIEKRFMIGLVCPKKGAERLILQQMNTCLAEAHLREYYGEKMDAQEQDDYWPFVCIPLTSPSHCFE